jgi:hypothetical protein
MSEQTAQLVSLGDVKGTIEVGKHADFVIWDPEARFIVEPDGLQMKNKISPYNGQELYGVVKATYLRGSLIYNGEAPGGFVNDDARFDDCPTRCVPADQEPTFLRYHFSLDSDNCPAYQSYEPCPGITRCAADEWPTECQVSWGAWSECSATCGGGQQERRRGEKARTFAPSTSLCKGSSVILIVSPSNCHARG